jgi:hypothetical protein
MMGKVEEYRRTLRELDNWDSLLLRECGLPGPRGNIELARAVADEGDEELFHRYLSFDAEVAPANSPQEFLAFCGVLGLGRLVSEGKTELLGVLREWASDPRWRTREAVAMALQRLGQVDMDLLLGEMETWSRGGLLERRAAAAGLCEPILLGQPEHARRVLEILDAITASIVNEEDRRSDQFRALRKGLGYCWSVAVVALPDQGKKMMEEWLSSDDRDVRWILKENLRKKRLERLDAEWVRQSRVRLESR